MGSWLSYGGPPKECIIKAANWIDKVKVAKDLQTDYATAKFLGLSPNAVSNYRTGLRNTLDEAAAIKVAKALGIDPAGIIVDQIAERSKSPEVRSSLLKVAAQLLYIMSTQWATRIRAASKNRLTLSR